MRWETGSLTLYLAQRTGEAPGRVQGLGWVRGDSSVEAGLVRTRALFFCEHELRASRTNVHREHGKLA